MTVLMLTEVNHLFCSFVVFTKTIIHFHVVESDEYYPSLRQRIVNNFLASTKARDKPQKTKLLPGLGPSPT